MPYPLGTLYQTEYWSRLTIVPYGIRFNVRIHEKGKEK